MDIQFFLVTAQRFSIRQRMTPSYGWFDVKVSEKASAILAYLLWKRAPLRRDELAELFWEGVSVEQARNSLRQALFQLRALLGPDIVRIERGTVQLLVPLASDTELEKPASECRPRVRWLREQFALHSTIRGVAFDTWVAAVRSRAAPLTSELDGLTGDGIAAVTRNDFGVRPNTSGLDLLWTQAVSGGGAVFWLNDDQEWLVQRLHHIHRRNGGHVAHVQTDGSASKHDVEQAIARALWQMAGAAGIQPERRKLLERLTTSSPVSVAEVQETIWDLMCAVADEAPLLLLVQGWSMAEMQEIQMFLAERLQAATGIRLIAVAVSPSGQLPTMPALILPVSQR